MSVHPTAVVHPDAQIAADVEVGAYSVVDACVEIGAGTRIGHHCVISGRTRIGRNNRIWSFVSLGGPPQDKKYRGEPTALEIGDDNTIREFCTFNIGTIQDVGTTRLGNGNWIMAYVHLAHDCQVGNNTIFANNAQLAGHVHVGDFAILGGFTAVHQFVHIGAHSITSIGTVLLQDLPPYVMAGGNPTRAHGINSEGLRRRGFAADVIDDLRRAYRTLYRSGHTLEEAKSQLASQAQTSAEIRQLLDFLASAGRGIVR
jgi:UDP-N-acetylglucosamine acyltransferase